MRTPLCPRCGAYDANPGRSSAMSAYTVDRALRGVVCAGSFGTLKKPRYEYVCLECGCNFETDHNQRTGPETPMRCLHKTCGIRFTHPESEGVTHICPHCGRSKTVGISVDAGV